MKFKWDNNKNKANIEKHGLDFNDASLFFENPYLCYEDIRNKYNEKRFIGIG